jgi:hypothetical protein
MRAQLPRELHAYGEMAGNRQSLDAGAPSITYEGNQQAGGIYNQGSDRANAMMMWNQMSSGDKSIYDFNFEMFLDSGDWMDSILGEITGGQEDMMVQIKEAYKQHKAQGGQESFEEFIQIIGEQDQGRAQAAYGGIMGADGRKQYGIGSWFQKAKDKVVDDLIPNELKNPAGVIAAATAANYLPKMMGGEETLLQKFLPKGITQTISNLNPFNKNPNARETGHPTMTGDAGRGGNDKWWMEGIKDISKTGDYVGTPPYVGGSTQNTDSKNKWYSGLGSTIAEKLLTPEFLIPAAGLVGGAFAKEDEPLYTGQGTGLNIRDIGKLANISDEKVGQAAGLRFLPEVSARKYTPAEMIATYAATEPANFETPEKAAQGGRIGYRYGQGVESVPTDQMESIKGQTAGPAGYHRILEEQMSLLAEELDKHPSDLTDDEYELAGNRAMQIWRSGGFAQGGRIGYSIGGITEEQDAMIRDMLNRKMDIETISTMGGVTPEQIQIIIDQINEGKKGLEESGALEDIMNLKAEGGRIGYSIGGRKGLMKLGGREGRIKPDMLEQATPGPQDITTDQMKRIKGQMAGPQWWWDRVQHLEFLGYSHEQASQIAMDDDAYFQIVGGGPKMAQGGRIGALQGGLMNLGGMEMDLRGGGFVPIGAKEKADDVPARLSKNEFVFTADAVRAAGGGSVDAGADKMYKTMKDLEGMVA